MLTSLYIALETYSHTHLCVGSILTAHIFHLLQALYMRVTLYRVGMHLVLGTHLRIGDSLTYQISLNATHTLHSFPNHQTPSNEIPKTVRASQQISNHM